MLNLHRDKKILRREPGRDGKILSDHSQDRNDEVGPSAISEMKKKKKNGRLGHSSITLSRAKIIRRGSHII